MTKFYKNLKIGAVITAVKYQEKVMNNTAETSADLGTMDVGSYGSIVNDVCEDYSQYVPYDPETKVQ